MSSTTQADEKVSGATAAGTGVEAGAATRGAETVVETGQPEAYSLNMKRLVANELDHDQVKRSVSERVMRNGEDGDQVRRTQTERIVEEAIQLQTKLNDQYLTHVAQLQATMISERERTVRVGDVASENMWTVDRAALEAIVAAAVAAAVNRKDGT